MPERASPLAGCWSQFWSIAFRRRSHFYPRIQLRGQTLIWMRRSIGSSDSAITLAKTQSMPWARSKWRQV